MPFTLSPGRLAVSVLCGALATGIFHLTQHGRSASAATGALSGVFDPGPKGVASSVPPAAGPALAAPAGIEPPPKAPGRAQAERMAALASPPSPLLARSLQEQAVRQPGAHRDPDGVSAGKAPGTVSLAVGNPRGHAAGQDHSAPLGVARSPRRIVFRLSSPGIVVLTLEGDRLDVEFKEGR